MTPKLDKDQARTHIRWVIPKDMPEVLQIEKTSYEPGIAWTEEDFRRCLKQRNCISMVAEQGEMVVGYVVYELHKRKLYIMNMTVHPSRRRLLVGTRMINKLINKLASHQRNRISTVLRETNLAAQLFLRSNGFRSISILKRWFEDTREDGYVFQYRLPITPEQAS